MSDKIRYVFKFSISLLIGFTATNSLAYSDIEEKFQLNNTILKESKLDIKSILTSSKWVDESKRVWEFMPYNQSLKRGDIKLTSNNEKSTLNGHYFKSQKNELIFTFKSPKFSKDQFSIVLKDIKVEDNFLEFIKNSGESIKMTKLREV